MLDSKHIAYLPRLVRGIRYLDASPPTTVWTWLWTLRRKLQLILRLAFPALSLSTLQPCYAQSGSPSFDCSQARSWSEIAVCSDANLARLDVQLASLYREAKARSTGQTQHALITEQKAWLKQREDCKRQSDQSACLYGIYNRRIAQLGGTSGSQQSKAPAPGFGSGSRQTAPLGEITPNVVWRDHADVFSRCDHPDFRCVINRMRQTGASDESIRFVERYDAWAIDFRDFGRIDLLTIETFAAGGGEFLLLVNGSPDMVGVESYDLTKSDKKRPDVMELLQRNPGVDVRGLEPQRRFPRYEAVTGGYRFIFTNLIVAGCRACEVIAIAEIAHDFDSNGVYKGAKLLRVIPVSTSS